METLFTFNMDSNSVSFVSSYVASDSYNFNTDCSEAFVVDWTSTIEPMAYFEGTSLWKI